MAQLGREPLPPAHKPRPKERRQQHPPGLAVTALLPQCPDGSRLRNPTSAECSREAADQSFAGQHALSGSVIPATRTGVAEELDDALGAPEAGSELLPS